MSDDIKALLIKQGEAHDAFVKSHAEEMTELKKGINDPLLTDRMVKIEKSLDAAVEGKAAIDASIAAEIKEREDLEVRLSRMGNIGQMDEAKAVALHDMNHMIKSLAASRNKGAEIMDEKGFDAYKSAHDRWMREGKENLDSDEVKTLSVGVDADGGYFVTPDTSGRIVRKVFESSPARQVFSSLTISTDKLEGIEDLDEAGAGYAGETAQGSDTTTPSVGKWSIPVYWIDTEPKTTQQLLDDSAVNIEEWLTGKVARKFARFENAEFVSGSNAKIRGLTSYDTLIDNGSGVAWGKMGHVKSGANGAFAGTNPGDAVFDLVGALKNEYLPNAGFMTKRKVITAIRKFKDGQGNYLWQPSFVVGQPETILGHSVTRAEDMPDLATGAISLAFGDFSECYQIVDRQGIKVLRDNLTSKPYVKFYTTKRTGGGVVNFEAVKFMKFSA